MPVGSLRILFALFLASSCGAFSQAQHDPAVAIAAQKVIEARLPVAVSSWSDIPRCVDR